MPRRAGLQGSQGGFRDRALIPDLAPIAPPLMPLHAASHPLARSAELRVPVP